VHRIRVYKFRLRNNLLFAQHPHYLLMHRARRGAGILRKKGKYHYFLHACRHQPPNSRFDRRVLVPHGQLYPVLLAQQLLHLLHQPFAVEFERRAIGGPEQFVRFSRFARTKGGNNPPNQQVAGNGIDIDHAWIEQKLLQISINGAARWRIGRAQIDYQDAGF
jgi:hypothetical protein